MKLALLASVVVAVVVTFLIRKSRPSMDHSPKRARTDAAAITPSDMAKSPMAAARESIATTAASLQPKLASVLSRLAVDYLVCCHKHYQKGLQVKRFTDDEDWIPKSARNNFDLKGSKLVEQDEEYTTLVAESQDLVDTFRKDLRGKIFAATKLEVKKMKQLLSDTLASNL